MTQPLVSAVTIVRDGERFLAEAIESALDQTYRNLELIVVDDGSTDRSAEIAERFARAEPGRVRLVRHADGGSRGMSAARTLGVAASHGALIGFLDADDVWLPNKTAEQVAVLDAYPAAGMVYGRTQIWYSWDANPVRSDFFYDLGVAPDRLYPPLRLLPQLLENRVQSPTPCNALIRREAYEEAGGFEATVLRPSLRRPRLLREAVPAVGDLRLEPLLGPLPPARGERAERAIAPLLLRPLLPRTACIPRVACAVFRRRPDRRRQRRRARVGALAGAASLPRRPRGTAAAGCAAGGAQPTRLGGEPSP